MKKLITQLPLPICGLMLGLVSLSNLQSMIGYSFFAKICLILSLIILLLVAIKFIIAFKNVRQQLQNPIIASVFPTFLMSGYLFASLFELQAVWWIIIALQFVYIVYFTYKHVWNKQNITKEVYPSWFVVYVGIGMVPLTAGAYSTTVADVYWYASIVLFVCILPFVLYKVFMLKNMPEPTLPIITILSAPASLALTGYLSHFQDLNITVCIVLFIFSQLLYLIVLFKMKALLKLPFYPSYAAFTFPLVITATAVYKYKVSFPHIEWLKYVFYVEWFIATVMVCYVTIRYVVFLYTICVTKK